MKSLRKDEKDLVKKNINKMSIEFESPLVYCMRLTTYFTNQTL